MSQELQGYVTPEPCGLSRSQVFDLAETIAETLGYQPGSSLTDVVQSLGGRITYNDPTVDERSGVSGSIYMRKSSFRIVLSLHTGPLRDRFTIAHELGHWVLHYIGTLAHKNDQLMVADRFGSGAAETEANWFAAAFLMPTQAFQKAWQELNGDTLEIAALFRVSEQSAAIRAKSLGLSNDA